MQLGRGALVKLCAFLVPLSLAMPLAWWGKGAQGAAHSPEDRRGDYLRPVAVDDVSTLERLFSDLDYTWPPQPGRSVPRIAVEPLPADYALLGDIRARKSLFFRVLLPMVLAENARILRQREQLQEIFRGNDASAADSPHGLALREVMAEYRVQGDPTSEEVRAELLRRVDTVPVALVLAQAANESGWGTSRFARLGNNLFGVWTYQAGEGIVPYARTDGETHAVRVFGSMRASVRAHLHNLNIGHAYEDLRRLRAGIRAQGTPLDSLVLANGLERYSSRGEEYIGEIQAIIRANRLSAVRNADLREGDLRTASARPRPAESRGG